MLRMSFRRSARCHKMISWARMFNWHVDGRQIAVFGFAQPRDAPENADPKMAWTCALGGCSTCMFATAVNGVSS